MPLKSSSNQLDLMTVTLTGPIVLENLALLRAHPTPFELDGQMYISTGNVLTGKFRYFNIDDILFKDMGTMLGGFMYVHAYQAVSESLMDF